jgi:hypothetical protein
MKKLTASKSNAEVLGKSILRYIESLNYEAVKPILKKHKLTDIQPDTWYPHQRILDLLRDIQDPKYNVPGSLEALGIKIMKMADLPPNVNSIPAMLNALGVLYGLHHRNFREMGWSARKIGPGHVQVTHDSPYPEDLAYGIVWGAVNRFRPCECSFMVAECENCGSDLPQVFDVTWEE